MKKSLLILTVSLLFVTAKSFAQTPPTTFWADEATTAWYSESQNEFTLSTAEELAGLAALVDGGNDFANKTVLIDADIDLGEHLWLPIGSGYETPFSGTVDGNGFTISNLFINNPDGDWIGLFGQCVNSTLSNINIDQVYIRAKDTVGAIAGNFSTNSNMTNCHATGVDIVASKFNIGGLVGGLITNSTMHRCSSEGSVTGTNQVGGLVGSPWDLTEISECYSAGTVTGQYLAGGLIGFSTMAFGPNRENVIINCFSRADVSVVDGRAGGLVGGTDVLLEVYNSYSTGTATGNELAGGFIGAVGNVTVEHAYWDTETSEHEDAIGGYMGAPLELDITGKTTAEMKTAEMVNLLGQGQNESPWTINPDINDGYPSFIGMTVSVSNIQLSNVEVSVYPNLVDTYIQIEAIANLKSYSIYDVSGKIIAQGTLMGNASQIDAENLSSGAYILLINTDQGSASQKFMKK